MSIGLCVKSTHHTSPPAPVPFPSRAPRTHLDRPILQERHQKRIGRQGHSADGRGLLVRPGGGQRAKRVQAQLGDGAGDVQRCLAQQRPRVGGEELEDPALAAEHAAAPGVPSAPRGGGPGALREARRLDGQLRGARGRAGRPRHGDQSQRLGVDPQQDDVSRGKEEQDRIVGEVRAGDGGLRRCPRRQLRHPVVGQVLDAACGKKEEGQVLRVIAIQSM